MAVTGAVTCNIQPLAQIPPELQSFSPSARFYGVGALTGDGTGGAVTCTFACKQVNYQDFRYFILQDVDVEILDTTASDSLHCSLLSDDWAEIAGLGASKYITRSIPVSKGTVRSGCYQRASIFPWLLGQPSYSGAATIRLYYPTNTNAKEYNFWVRGVIFDKFPAHVLFNKF